MHGRKKVAQSTDQTTALQKKAQQLSATISLVLGKKTADDFSEEALELTGNVLRSLTDFYSVWNYRRRILASMNAELAAVGRACDLGAEPKLVDPGLVDRELKLSEDSIRKNPKSYGAWHHRLWVVQRFKVDYEHELNLCKLLLTEDQRNFHCWCYRRAVVHIGGITAADEFAYSTEKIEENFSNYSAFHHRSVFFRTLTSAHSSSSSSSSGGGVGEDTQRMLEEELVLVENAVYTEPDDQSAWWYHQFLLKWSAQQCTAATAAVSADAWAWYRGVLQGQVCMVRDLLALDDGCKWALSALAMLLAGLLDLHHAGNSGDAVDSEALLAEHDALLERLCTVDPDHANRYRHLLRQRQRQL